MSRAINLHCILNTPSSHKSDEFAQKVLLRYTENVRCSGEIRGPHCPSNLDIDHE